MPEKYSKNGPFTDPVVRCHECRKIVRVEKLKERGSCSCGCRKVQELRGFTREERDKMDDWGIDPDFLAIFGEVSDDE